MTNLATYSANTLDHIRSDLDSWLLLQSHDVQEHPIYPILKDNFQFIQREEVDRILRRVRPTTLALPG